MQRIEPKIASFIISRLIDLTIVLLFQSIFTKHATAAIYILPVSNPSLSEKCHIALLDAQNQLSDYLIPGNSLDRLRLRMKNTDIIYNYPVVASLWNYSSEYSETPPGRILMATLSMEGLV